jgi:prepilin-type N-terminal cleavage/methylation domain-containing protein
MKGGLHSRVGSAGFTIVEVMIVLAVTAMLFVLYTTTKTGRQARTQYMQATNDIQTVIQQTINEVSAGYYPNNQSFLCNVTGSGTSTALTITNVAATDDQGTRDKCIFLGKVMQFGMTPDINGAEPYATYSIAAARKTEDQLSNVGPTVLQALTQVSTLKYGLEAKSVKTGGTAIGAVAFLNDLGTVTDGSYQSGSQQVNLVALAGTGINRGQDITNIQSGIKNATTAFINPPAGVTICFSDGAQTALVTIGSNGHDLLVKMEVKACS